jgi:hypothetical protein
MPARELPKKRRPTEVSALIIGSAGAIGWHNPNLKVDMACIAAADGIRTAATCGPPGRARTDATFTKENTNE